MIISSERLLLSASAISTKTDISLDNDKSNNHINNNNYNDNSYNNSNNTDSDTSKNIKETDCGTNRNAIIVAPIKLTSKRSLFGLSVGFEKCHLQTRMLQIDF